MPLLDIVLFILVINSMIIFQVSEILTISPLLREILERISIADFDTQWDEGR